MSNKHMKKCSIPLVIRELQIKLTMRYHFIHTIIEKKWKNNKCWQAVEKLEACPASGVVK